MLHIFCTFSGVFKAGQKNQFSSIKYVSIYLFIIFEELMERVNLFYHYSSTAGFIMKTFSYFFLQFFNINIICTMSSLQTHSPRTC